MSFPKRKIPAASAWLAFGLVLRALSLFRGRQVPERQGPEREPMFLSQYQRRP